MQIEEVEQILQAGLESCRVEVTGDGSHFNLLLVGNVFAGLNRLKRQQLVYAVLNEQIMSGELHAVNMQTFTEEEFAAQS